MRSSSLLLCLLLTAFIAPSGSASFIDEVCEDAMPKPLNCGQTMCSGLANGICYFDDELGNCYPLDEPCTTDADFVYNTIYITRDEILAFLDPDGDLMPDAAEPIICGRVATEALLEASGQGSCETASDMNFEPTVQPALDLVAFALMQANEVKDEVEAQQEYVQGEAERFQEETTEFVLGFVDADGDGIPDTLEPYLCLVEDRSNPVDGSCTGNDYHPYV